MRVTVSIFAPYYDGVRISTVKPKRVSARSIIVDNAGVKECWVANYAHLCRVPRRLLNASPIIKLDTLYFQDGIGRAPVLNKSSPMLRDVGDQGMLAVMEHLDRMDQSAKKNSGKRGNTNLMYAFYAELTGGFDEDGNIIAPPKKSGGKSGPSTSLTAGGDTHVHSKMVAIPLERLRVPFLAADAADAEDAAGGMDVFDANAFAPHSFELSPGQEAPPSFHVARGGGGKCVENLINDAYGRVAWRMLHGWAEGVAFGSGGGQGWCTDLVSALNGEFF